MKSKQIKIIFAFLLGCSFTAQSQSLSDFKWFKKKYENKVFLGFGYNNVSITNNDAPNPENHELKGGTLRIDVSHTNFEKGGARINYTNKLGGDLILFASEIISGKGDIFQTEQSTLSSGLIGWLTFTWNITEARNYQVALGAHIGDYFLTSAYPEDETKPFNKNSNSIVLEPNGNYYGAGPSAIVNVLLTKNLLLEYRTHLTIPAFRLESLYLVSDGNYKNPYFMNNNLELITSKGFYGGADLSNIINRGNLPNNTKRFELYVGFKLKI
tara:strand:- start:1453 stop:2262 length:810 start_codon:yes stop_codon:yes gene_type:complete